MGGRSRRGVSLFWRVCLIHGAVFAAGTAVLAASPATVSAPVLATEAIVLAVGLGAMLLANGVLLRATLAPLDRLSHLMEGVDLLRPGQRLPDTGYGAVSHLIGSFNAMIARLEAERSSSSALALAAQEAERQRVAQELHDEVGQGLTAVLLGLQRVAARVPAEVRQPLTRLEQVHPLHQVPEAVQRRERGAQQGAVGQQHHAQPDGQYHRLRGQDRRGHRRRRRGQDRGADREHGSVDQAHPPEQRDATPGTPRSSAHRPPSFPDRPAHGLAPSVRHDRRGANGCVGIWRAAPTEHRGHERNVGAATDSAASAGAATMRRSPTAAV